MIIDLQRRIQESGRIRIGQQVPTGRGKARPAKLDSFRLTSPDRAKIEHAAALYGGTAVAWQAPAGPQWEVVTTTDVLDVIVPPADMAFSQWYELWSAGGCQRRCDGQTETIGDRPCACDPDNRECDIHSRLSVMLADMPGLGVWRIDTSGYYAAVELSGAVAVVQSAAARGSLLPARLRLEQRTVKRVGAGGEAQTRRFAVPVLDVEITPAALLGGATRAAMLAPSAPAVDGEPPRLTPVPESLPAGPSPSIREQIEPPPPRPRRVNSAPPIPPSGVKRGEPEVVEAEPWDAEDEANPESEPEPTTPEPTGPEQSRPEQATPEWSGGMTVAQSRKMGALMRQVGLTDRDDALTYVTGVIGRPVNSRSELSKSEASKVIEQLVLQQQEQEPPPGEDPWSTPIQMEEPR